MGNSIQVSMAGYRKRRGPWLNGVIMGNHMGICQAIYNAMLLFISRPTWKLGTLLDDLDPRKKKSMPGTLEDGIL